MVWRGEDNDRTKKNGLKNEMMLMIPLGAGQSYLAKRCELVVAAKFST